MATQIKKTNKEAEVRQSQLRIVLKMENMSFRLETETVDNLAISVKVFEQSMWQGDEPSSFTIPRQL